VLFAITSGRPPRGMAMLIEPRPDASASRALEGREPPEPLQTAETTGTTPHRGVLA